MHLSGLHVSIGSPRAKPPGTANTGGLFVVLGREICYTENKALIVSTGGHALLPESLILPVHGTKQGVREGTFLKETARSPEGEGRDVG